MLASVKWVWRVSWSLLFNKTINVSKMSNVNIYTHFISIDVTYFK
jgi:hypothetical protein